MSNITVNVSALASINIFGKNTKYVEVKEDHDSVYIRPTEYKDGIDKKFYKVSKRPHLTNCTKFGINTTKLGTKEYYILSPIEDGWFKLNKTRYCDININSEYVSTFVDEIVNNSPSILVKIEMNAFTRINFINNKINSFEVKNNNGIFMFKPSKKEINDKNGKIISDKQFYAISNCLEPNNYYEVSKVRGWLICKEINGNIKGKNIIHVMAA